MEGNQPAMYSAYDECDDEIIMQLALQAKKISELELLISEMTEESNNKISTLIAGSRMNNEADHGEYDNDSEYLENRMSSFKEAVKVAEISRKEQMELQRKLEDVEKSYNQIVSEKDKLMSKYNECVQHVDKLQSQVLRLSTELDSSNEDYSRDVAVPAKDFDRALANSVKDNTVVSLPKADSNIKTSKSQLEYLLNRLEVAERDSSNLSVRMRNMEKDYLAKEEEWSMHLATEIARWKICEERLQSIVSEKDDLQRRYDEMSRELSETSSLLSAARLELDTGDVAMERANAAVQIQAKILEYDEINKQFLDATDTIKQLTADWDQERRALVQTVNQLQTSSTDLMGENSRLLILNGTLGKSCNVLEAELSRRGTEIEGLSQRCRELSENLAAKDKDLHHSSELVLTMMSQCEERASLIAQHDAQIQQRDDVISELKSKMCTLEQQMTSREEEAAVMTSQATSLRDKLEAVRGDADKYITELKVTRAEKEQADRAHGLVVAELEAARTSLRETSEALDDVRRNYERLAADHSGCTAREALCNDRERELAGKLEETSSEVAALNMRLRSSLDVQSTLKSECEELDTVLIQTDEALRLLQEQHEDLLVRYDDLQSKFEAVQQESAVRAQEASVVQMMFHDTSEAYEELETKYREIEIQYADVMRELEDHRERQKQGEIRDLEKDISEIKTDEFLLDENDVKDLKQIDIRAVDGVDSTPDKHADDESDSLSLREQLDAANKEIVALTIRCNSLVDLLSHVVSEARRAARRDDGGRRRSASAAVFLQNDVL